MERTPGGGGGQRRRPETLSERQRQVLDCIRRHLLDHKRPPTRGEIARDVSGLSPRGTGRGRRGAGLSPTAVDYHLKQLALRGWIELSAGVQRGIRLLREGTPLVGLAEVDRIDENDPATARIEDIAELLGAEPDAFVRIDDEATAKEAGLRMGDIVAIAHGREPQEGDLVLARTREGATLRRCGASARDIATGTDGAEVIGVVTNAIAIISRCRHRTT